MIGKAVSSLPAGLLDDNIELFSHNGMEYATCGGRVIPFTEFPEWLLKLLDQAIEADEPALSALIEADLVKKDDIRRQYIRCCFGVFDGKPDILNGELQKTEYWNCENRGKCPYEGRLCKAVLVHDNVYLTPREVEVLKIIDLQAKEIADRLHISETTVPKFKANIFEKTGMNRQGDLIKYAISKNLIRLD